ncbi:hypothetical protein HanIR_Chr14g0725791 [Helianthus annuus]|nr:hypothetical protein HanIR_Chr14g0725791 [Helianthus annuus]
MDQNALPQKDKTIRFQQLKKRFLKFGLKWQQNVNLRDPELKILDFGLKWQN